MAIGFGGRSAGIKWTPPLHQMAQLIQDLRDPVYDTVYNDLKYWVPKLRIEAQTNAPWLDRTGKARRGLFAYRRRGASFMMLALSHGPRTVSNHSASWPNFRYGVMLETALYEGSTNLSAEEREWMKENKFEMKEFTGPLEGFSDDGHGTYAVIMPTMEAHYAEIMASFRGALERAIRKQL